MNAQELKQYERWKAEVHFLRSENQHLRLELAALRPQVYRASQKIDRLGQLNEKLRGQAGTYRDRSLDVSIWRLRRLLETDPSEPRYVQTVWGQGYIFVPQGETGAAERAAWRA